MDEETILEEDKFNRKLFGDDFVNRIQKIELRLKEVEKPYKEKNPEFEIQRQWYWSTLDNQRFNFGIEPSCKNETLKEQILNVICEELKEKSAL